MSTPNMAGKPPRVHTSTGLDSEHSGNIMAVPERFQEIASLCVATEEYIGGVLQLCVADHRTLHAGLKVGRDHTNWVKGRIKECGLVEGKDYEIGSPDRANQTGQGGDRRSKAYRLSLHAAKQIAMMEGGEVGKLVRSYFIWVEENTHRIVDAARQVVRRRERTARSRLTGPMLRELTSFPERMMAAFPSMTEADRRTAFNRLSGALLGEPLLPVHEAAPCVIEQPPALPPTDHPKELGPTEIGVEIGLRTGQSALSGRAVNALLKQQGFQTKGATTTTPWHSTAKGEPFAKWETAEKAGEHGGTVNVLRWRYGIVDELLSAMNVTQGEG
ncbi:phage anti-repressor protein [Azospirillum agricola]|uniref:antA/AntB antirepressor family protein n=1 Tax=Azospirillum agricola TaxID=1720247 RepID=UPI001AE1B130|nr:antA/AntB antirepressor family protein [Azospirillum agricola]MBP2229637.1 phage anti-repressor protein [Azospirillum agricola]